MMSRSAERPTVAIVGGGLAGMAAAAALSRFPVTVHLFESKRVAGGRAGSFLDGPSGTAVDYCQHVSMGCCTNFEHLMRACGLDGEFQRYSDLTFLAEGCSPSAFRPSRRLPPPLHMASVLGHQHYLTSAERRQIWRAMWRLMRMTPALDDPASRAPVTSEPVTSEPATSSVTMGQWLRRNGQTDPVIAKFWNTVLASALGEHVDWVAVEPARKVFIDGFLSAHGASDLLVPRQPLSILFGQRLPEVLGQRGVTMHFGARVRRCEVENDGRFRLQFEQHPPLLADDLILAVPWHAAPRILEGTSLAAAVDHLENLGRIPSSPISGIHLWMDREITALPHAVIVNRMSQWVFRPPACQLRTERDEHYYQVVVSAAHDLRGHDPAEIRSKVVDDLMRVFPQAAPLRCLRSRIVTDPMAVFSARPEVEAMRPACSTGREGLFLAGDWVRTGWPATMEGAVISGYRAAEGVVGRWGHQARCVQPPLAAPWLARALMRLGKT